VVNLSDGCSYLEEGYYRSQALEMQGSRVIPGTAEILDAQVVPLALARARLAGIPTPEHYISNGYFEPPALLDPVNPFMSGHALVLRAGRRDQVARSLTRNYTYAICCQELSPGARVSSFRLVLGWTRSPNYRAMGAAVWEAFRLPLARVRIIRPASGRPLFSAIEPLPLASLTPPERAILEEGLEWRA
jgi:hypothetical protein